MIQQFLNENQQLILCIVVGAVLCFMGVMVIKFYHRVPKKGKEPTAKDIQEAKAIAQFVQLMGQIERAKTNAGIDYWAEKVLHFENHFSKVIDPVAVQMMTSKLYDKLHDQQSKILSISS